MRIAAMLVVLGLIPTPAHAEPWYRGRYGANRVTHVSLTVGGGALWIASETFLKSDLAAKTCRWCVPDSVDNSVRDSLVWKNTGRAATLSNLGGYVLAPAAALGLVLAGTLRERDATWAQVIDDTVPIFETVVATQLVTQAAKFAVGRSRPGVHFGPPAPHDVDDNLSFFSGHTSLTFGLATSAGMIAHARGYATEPYIWGAGMTIAATTGYLRIAADKHYFTDVVTGAAVGIAGGLTVPFLMRRGLEVVPKSNGLAIAGTW